MMRVQKPTSKQTQAELKANLQLFAALIVAFRLAPYALQALQR